jgi:hypothetical protein
LLCFATFCAHKPPRQAHARDWEKTAALVKYFHQREHAAVTGTAMMRKHFSHDIEQ